MAMGCWALGGDRFWGAQDEAESIAAVHAALDVGVNFFDTAEAYGAGRSEQVLGKALAGRRGRAVIATKVSPSHLSRQEIERACESSLRRLQSDYIDLYQIHWPNRQVPLAESMEALERLRRAGKVRAIGVCNFGVKDLSDLLALGRCQSNQLPYSLLWRAIEYQIRGKCIEEGVGMLAYSPLAMGLLTGKLRAADEVPEGRASTRLFSNQRPAARHGEAGRESEVFATVEKVRQISQKIQEPMAKVAIAWALGQPGMTSVIVGARNPDQIRRNAQALDLELPSDVVDELNEATRELKRKLGPNPDMWQSESRFR